MYVQMCIMCVCVCNNYCIYCMYVYIVCMYVQMLVILLSIVSKSGIVDEIDFAERLHGWMRHGFKDLGDHGKYCHHSLH